MWLGCFSSIILSQLRRPIVLKFHRLLCWDTPSEKTGHWQLPRCPVYFKPASWECDTNVDMTALSSLQTFRRRSRAHVNWREIVCKFATSKFVSTHHSQKVWTRLYRFWDWKAFSFGGFQLEILATLWFFKVCFRPCNEHCHCRETGFFYVQLSANGWISQRIVTSPN